MRSSMDDGGHDAIQNADTKGCACNEHNPRRPVRDAIITVLSSMTTSMPFERMFSPTARVSSNLFSACAFSRSCPCITCAQNDVIIYYRLIHLPHIATLNDVVSTGDHPIENGCCHIPD